MNIKSFFKGTLQIVAFATLISVAATSCADDSMTTTAKAESSKAEFAGLAKSTLQVSLGGGIQLDPATRSLDSDGAETRSVLISRNGRKYTPIAEDGKMKARVFIVKETTKKTINGTEAIDPANIDMGAAEIEFKATTLPDGRISLYYPENTMDFLWLRNSVVPKPGEKWYICAIIGGEYNKSIGEAAKTATNPNDRSLYEKLYHFYVDFDPNLSPKHNQIDANGNVQVAAPYTTGWIKMDDIKKAGVIDQRRLHFKPIGTLLHFRVKRDPNLVPAEACRYTFASSQLSANGAFLMMPQSMFRSGEGLAKDYSLKVDCEVRPWTNSIEKNFYWSYEGDRQLHMNNTSSDIKTESDIKVWGDPLYEYRYTFDAKKMRGDNPKDGYDDFYVWGMPIPYDKYIGQTMMTAERGGYMLGRKQEPKDGQKPKYPYADEWLYASGEPQMTSGEYKVLDFRAENKKNKAYSVELGVCRPRFSDPKYPWANPLERLAVTNSNTEGAPKTFHTDNADHSNTGDGGYVKGWSLKSGEFKMRFVLNTEYLPDGYHVPSGEEWGLVLPNKVKSLQSMQIYNDLLGWDNIETAPGGLYEMYNPYKDDMRNRIVAGFTNNESEKETFEKETKPAFLSYYMQDRNKLELYAIRFNGNIVKAADKQGRQLPGNRYCCAYRWRMMNAGGPAGTNYGNGMRVIIQSRWIGNANVSVRDLVDDAWWGPVSHNNPLFKTDCYRILNCAGYPYSGGLTDWTWYVTYWSRTRWEFHGGADDESTNKVFCYRRIYNEGYNRGHFENATKHFPVRLLCGRDQDEFGPNAPRQKQSDLFNEDLLHRNYDAGVDWTYPKKKK
ncbi:hypothetical protein [Prevotella sp.]